MVHVVEPRHPVSLADYESVAPLSAPVRNLRQEAKSRLPGLQGRRVFMVNSTSHGGGVAELLPPLLALLREQGRGRKLAGDGNARSRVLPPDQTPAQSHTRRG